MEVDVRILFLLASLLCVCECRHVHKHHHNKRLHPGFPPLPLPPHHRSSEHLEDTTGHIYDTTRSKLYHLKPEHHSEKRTAQHKTVSPTTAVPKTTQSKHPTAYAATHKPATKHSHAASTKAHPTLTIPKTTTKPTSKPTSKHQTTHHGTVKTTAPPHKHSQKLSNAKHTKLDKHNLKAAVAKLESDLHKILKDVLDEENNVQHSSSVASTTPFTGTTTIGTQTTPKPFPGQYQGYIPVTKATPKHAASDVGKSLKMPRNADYGDTDKKRSITLSNSHGGSNPLHPHSPEDLTHTHNLVLNSLAKLNKDLLTGMIVMKNSLKILNINLRRALNSINDVSADNTNEERTDIKVNSDRIAQLQQGLEGKIDDLRYNISNLISSQRELAISMTWSLEKMMGMLSKMVDDVTSKDMEEEAHGYVRTPVPSTTIPHTTIKHATVHTTATTKVTHTTVASNHTISVQHHGGKRALPNTTHPGQSNRTVSKEQREEIESVVKRYNDHSIVNMFKKHRHTGVNPNVHERKQTREEIHNPEHVHKAHQKHSPKHKRHNYSTRHQHAVRRSDSYARNGRSYQSCWRKCRSSGTKKHYCLTICRHQK